MSRASLDNWANLFDYIGSYCGFKTRVNETLKEKLIQIFFCGIGKIFVTRISPAVLWPG